MQMNYLQEQILVLHQCQNVTCRWWARQCVPVSAWLKVYKPLGRKLWTELHGKCTSCCLTLLFFQHPRAALGAVSQHKLLTHLSSTPCFSYKQIHAWVARPLQWFGIYSSARLEGILQNRILNESRVESRLWAIKHFFLSWYHPKAMRTGLGVAAVRSLGISSLSGPGLGEALLCSALLCFARGGWAGGRNPPWVVLCGEGAEVCVGQGVLFTHTHNLCALERHLPGQIIVSRHCSGWVRSFLRQPPKNSC